MKLKTMTISGNEYAKVKERIKKFREDTTNGSIDTNATTTDDGTVILKAVVITDLSKDGSKRATGQAFGKIGTQKAFEKLETIAVGRALAFLGYLADGEVASFEEMEEFESYKSERKMEAVDKLNEAKTLDELKEIFMSLGNLMADKEIIKVKDEMKTKINENN